MRQAVNIWKTFAEIIPVAAAMICKSILTSVPMGNRVLDHALDQPQSPKLFLLTRV